MRGHSSRRARSNNYRIIFFAQVDFRLGHGENSLSVLRFDSLAFNNELAPLSSSTSLCLRVASLFGHPRPARSTFRYSFQHNAFASLPARAISTGILFY